MKRADNQTTHQSEHASDQHSARSALRILAPLAVLLIVSIGLILGKPVGTISAFGWGDISLLCPLGALSTMLAAKIVAPRPLISLGIAVVLVLLFGRAFCAYVCPTPLVARIRGISKKQAKQASDAPTQLTEDEKALLKGCGHGCVGCKPSRKTLDSRHAVLAGALLSAAVFGFPVFCLVCPVGLAFATIMLAVLLFGGGDVTIAVAAAPVLLLLEVVLFRKWCSHICPISALLSLISRGNKTFVPTVDQEKCIDCGRCAQACGMCIDPHKPEQGAPMAECTKCGACVDICPTKALSMPFLPKAKKVEAVGAGFEPAENEASAGPAAAGTEEGDKE